MSRDLLLFLGCLGLAVASGAGLVLLQFPDSFLSRLVDRPADDNTTDRKALR